MLANRWREAALGNRSIYLTLFEGFGRIASRLCLATYWLECAPKSESGRSPMWAHEVWQLAWLTIGVAGVLAVPRLGEGRDLLLVLALYRLFEILAFSLHWLLVDRRSVKDYRRALIFFVLNLVEVSVFSSLVAYALMPSMSRALGVPIYQNLQAVFSLRLVEYDAQFAGSELMGHLELAQAWLIALAILSVILSQIRRAEGY